MHVCMQCMRAGVNQVVQPCAHAHVHVCTHSAISACTHAHMHPCAPCSQLRMQYQAKKRIGQQMEADKVGLWQHVAAEPSTEVKPTPPFNPDKSLKYHFLPRDTVLSWPDPYLPHFQAIQGKLATIHITPRQFFSGMYKDSVAAG